MSESTKVIKSHAEHLIKLTQKADLGGVKDLKSLLDYLVLYKAAK